MLMYQCKHCGQFMLTGLVNKYNEHFCSQDCYKKYCESNQYEPDIEELSILINNN